MTLRGLLLLAGILQFGIAGLNLFLAPLLKWEADLARAPLLLREVFQVHVWFISITLAIFATITMRFSLEMIQGTNAAARWLAGGIGIFWGIRAILQITYYSASHWRGKRDRTFIHIGLLAVYGGFAMVYLLAAFGGVR